MYNNIFDTIGLRNSKFSTYLEEIAKVKDVNIKDTYTQCSMLQYAVSVGRFDIAEDLIKNRNIDVNIQDINGNTVLSYLTHKIDINLIKVILSKNADVNIKDKYGNTVLWKLITSVNASEDFYAFVELLLENGADISNNCNNSSMSVMDFAKLRQDDKLIEMIENAN